MPDEIKRQLSIIILACALGIIALIAVQVHRQVKFIDSCLADGLKYYICAQEAP